MGEQQRSSSYYGVLGVNSDSSFEEIRRAYRKLAMQWHPDRWTRNPSQLGEAKRKFQKIQEAYSVLSDKRKRTMYDAGLYDPEDEEDEGFADFVQEMVSLMKQTRREGKIYSLEELQSMFMDMAQGFEFDDAPLYCGSSVFGASHCSKRMRFDTNAMGASGSSMHVPSLGLYGPHSYCN